MKMTRMIAASRVHHQAPKEVLRPGMAGRKAALVLRAVCSSRATDRLPRLPIHTHVNRTEIASVCRRNPPNGWKDCNEPGMNHKGKCQKAQSSPTTRLARRGPILEISRGRAYPRHPGSSPKGPPKTRINKKVAGMLYQWRGEEKWGGGSPKSTASPVPASIKAAGVSRPTR